MSRQFEKAGTCKDHGHQLLRFVGPARCYRCTDEQFTGKPSPQSGWKCNGCGEDNIPDPSRHWCSKP